MARDFYRDLLGIDPAKILPTQRSYSTSGSRFRWWSGNRGGGKTVELVRNVAWYAVEVPNNIILLGRRYADHLYTTTIKTWFDNIDARRFGIKYFGGDKVKKAVFPNGSEVWFVGFDKDSRWLGNEIGMFAIDQAEELEEKQYLTLEANLRWRRCPAHMYRGLCVGNPKGHFWAWKRFVTKVGIDPQFHGDYAWFKNPKDENAVNQPPDYLKRLASSYSGVMLERMVLGSDEAFEGMAFSEWNDAENCKTFELEPQMQPILAYDHGWFPSPAVWIFGAYDPYTSTVFCRSELSGTRVTAYEWAERVRRRAEEIGFNLNAAQLIADYQVKATKNSAGVSVHQEFADLGFCFSNADKHLDMSLMRMNGLMRPSARTGKRRFFVHPDCTHTRTAMQTVGINEETGRLEGEGIDFADTSRYLTMATPEPIIESTKGDLRGTLAEYEACEESGGRFAHSAGTGQYFRGEEEVPSWVKELPRS